MLSENLVHEVPEPSAPEPSAPEPSAESQELQEKLPQMGNIEGKEGDLLSFSEKRAKKQQILGQNAIFGNRFPPFDMT